MALIPRWRYMTSSSKSLVKKTAISVVVILLGLTVLRALFPWLMLGLAIYGAYSLFNRS
tara:strand:+ start:455 stop:631 length:177 start_codon:yes stop_codon:yes gene_type:complete